MTLLIEKANAWLDLVEDVESEIEALPDASQLPSEDEAKKILAGVDPDRLEKIIAKVADAIDAGSVAVTEATAGETIKAITNTLRGLADPKIVMAVIALMGAQNSTEANVFSDFLNKKYEKIELTRDDEYNPDKLSDEDKFEILTKYDYTGTSEKGFGHVKYFRNDYFIGSGDTRAEAEENANTAMMKAGHLNDEPVKKGELKIKDLGSFEKDGKYYKIYRGA